MTGDAKSTDFRGARRAVLRAAVAGGLMALSLAPPALAGKPLINLGPKAAPKAPPLDFAAGDDLSQAGQGLIWQNEREGVRGLRQVVIPFFQVEFVTRSGAASNGAGNAQASVTYALVGPAEADMQAMTEALYGEFVANLEASGVHVIPYAEAEARSPGLQRLANMSKPAPYARGRTVHSAFYSPPGLKFYFTPNDGRAIAFGDTMTTTGSYVPEEMAMKELDAGVLGVRMVVDFAEIEARGRFMGMRPSTARVKSKANVALLPAESQMWVLTPKAKSSPMDLGHRQRYALTSPIIMPASVLSATDVTTGGSKASDAAVNVLGVLTGSGTSARTRSYQVTVDPVVWRRDVSDAMTQVGKAMISRLTADR